MFLVPYIFPGFVSNKIKQWARSSINAELDFSRARLSFFRHFPALTLTLSDLSLKGSAPFQDQTLVQAEEISLGVDIVSLFTSETFVDKIFLTNADINILVDKEGHANYNIYQSKNTDTTTTAPSDSSGVALRIEKILIEKSRLAYNDLSIPMQLSMKGLNYEGTGDLSKAVFDLHTHMQVDSFDFAYDNQSYVASKKINADLITRINTNSLALYFDKNDLKINQLPLQFNGTFEFLSNGYNMDFTLRSKETDLHDIFTGLPQDISQWLDKTEVKGFGDMNATLKGKYIADSSMMPDLTFNMKVRNGYISHTAAPSPVKNLFLNFQSKLPQLNTDSLQLTIDSIYFNIDQDYFSSVLRLKGLKKPEIYAKINSEIDLEKWDKAFGIPQFDLKGKYTLHLLAEGAYATTVQPRPVRGVDTVISSIPKFTLKSSLTNGYFKYNELPQAINNISFHLNASCSDNNYKHTSLSIEELNATVLNNFIKGFLKLGNGKGFPVNAQLQSKFNLADVKTFYPLDSIDLAGTLDIDVQANGKYMPEKKIFPVTQARFTVQNGTVHTKYYPAPLENIQVSAVVTSRKGSLSDLAVQVTPVSFRFEGQPFFVKADLQNFSNIRYNIVSKGTLNIGKIYRVFAVQGYDLKGFIETNFSLRGAQSDAVAGRYDQLFNTGTMKFHDVMLNADMFPNPFLIKTGLFRFEQDKMWLDAIRVNYGKSQLTLNGHLSNVLNYMMERGTPLKGAFDVSSNYLLVDEFMAYADPKANPSQAEALVNPGQAFNTTATPGTNKAAMGHLASPAAHLTSPAVHSTASTPTGVVMVPADLAVTLKANAKTVHYNGIDLKDFKGEVTIDSGAIKLKETGFNIIGTTVVMEGSYKSFSPRKAQFDYHINAKEFDVKRAYREIKLFHDLATAAEKADGIISLDYQLSGRLNENMDPVYPSLKGGGVLTLKKVKVKGLKLFTVVSKETNKEVNNPDLSKVEIKSTISNNLITIPRTKMKISPFRLRMEGQTSFDGKLNLKLRIGLPPLGIIGIPVHVSGTQDNPRIKLKRGENGELEETEDREEADFEEQ